AGDRDAGAKRERGLRRLEDAVACQAIQRIPVHGIRRAVVLPHHDDRVRVLVLDALDAPFNRDALAPVVGKRVAVMGERRGPGCEIESRRESSKASFHTALQRSEPMLPVYYEQGSGPPGQPVPGSETDGTRTITAGASVGRST